MHHAIALAHACTCMHATNPHVHAHMQVLVVRRRALERLAVLDFGTLKATTSYFGTLKATTSYFGTLKAMTDSLVRHTQGND